MGKAKKINWHVAGAVTLMAFISNLFFLMSCTGPKNALTRTTNMSFKKEELVLHPQMVIQHVSDSVSKLFFSVPASDLLYTRTSKGRYTANLLIRYQLQTSFETLQISDSGSVAVRDTTYNANPTLITGNIPIKCRTGNYYLQVTFTDVNRSVSSRSILTIDKTSRLVRQNFLLCDTTHRAPLFRDFLSDGEKAILSYNYAKGNDTLHVRYYNRQFPLPPPAFSNQPIKPFLYAADSTFTLVTNAAGEVKLDFPKTGFYHILTDTASREGFTVFRFQGNFPFLSDVKELVAVLRFITTRQEYEDLWQASDLRYAMEQFWIKNAGSEERARQTLSTYYSRAQQANHLFTSYVDGWKTDRGLISIIFGSPNTLYKDALSETWIYGEEASYTALSFTFVKVINPFSDNDFSLNRSDLYKDEWYKSVDTWRQGRIYNDR